jgi:hypothetical protein
MNTQSGIPSLDTLNRLWKHNKNMLFHDCVLASQVKQRLAFLYYLRAEMAYAQGNYELALICVCHAMRVDFDSIERSEQFIRSHAYH